MPISGFRPDTLWMLQMSDDEFLFYFRKRYGLLMERWCACIGTHRPFSSFSLFFAFLSFLLSFFLSSFFFLSVGSYMNPPHWILWRGEIMVSDRGVGKLDAWSVDGALM